MTNTNLKQYTPPPYIHSIAGGVGGAIGAIVTNPLEVSLILLFVGENTIYHLRSLKQDCNLHRRKPLRIYPDEKEIICLKISKS